MLCSGYALIYLFLRQTHNDRVGRLQLTATENHLSEVRVRRNGTFSCHHILIDKDKDRKERVSCNNDMQKNSLAGNRTPAAAVKTPNPSHYERMAQWLARLSLTAEIGVRFPVSPMNFMCFM